MENPNGPKSPADRRSLPLSDDLVAEILTRLPPKSVGRFRSVCKRWLSDTTEPRFALAHASRARTSGFFLFTSINGRAEHFPLDCGPRIPDPFLSFLDHGGLPPQFCDSRNGLVLLRKPQGCSCCNQSPVFSVVNPLTGSHLPIATPPELELQFSRSGGLFLVFDPSVSQHFHVVFVVVYSIKAKEPYTHIHMYSSETREWRLLCREPGRKYSNAGFFRGVVWNGCLIWHTCEDELICLDMKTEQIKWLSLPSLEEEFWCRYFGESGGRLHYIIEPETVTRESITHFDILEFRADTSEWFVLHKLDLDCIKDVYPEVNEQDLTSTIQVLYFLRGDNRAEDRLLLSIPEKIVCFHLHEKSFTTVCSGLTEDVSQPEWFYPYALSLVSLNTKPDASASCEDWICWKTEHDKQLLDLMVECSLKGQRSDDDFSIGAWHDMVEKLNAITGLKFDVNHLKDRLKSYRRDYHAVERMLKEEEFRWDPILEMVIAGDVAWREHIKVHSDAAYYRRRQVPFKNLEVIFGSLFL